MKMNRFQIAVALSEINNYDAAKREEICTQAIDLLTAAPVADAELLPYLRQYRHNDGSDGFVFGYEKEGADRIVATLRARLAAAVAAPDGYALLPLKASEAMLTAAESVDDLYRMGQRQLWGRVYRAMIAAAE